MADSPAENAGLATGDVIISVNRKSVHSGADLRNYIGLLRVGARVDLVLVRNGDEMKLSLKVGEIKQAYTEPGKEIPKLKGASFGPIPQDSPFFGRIKGVFVVGVLKNSPAWKAGLREEDVITSINRQLVANSSELMTIAGQSGGSLLLNIARGEGSLFILIR